MSKSPATPDKGFIKLEEFRFKVVYDYKSPTNPNSQWWVIENKLYANLPVKKKPRVEDFGLYFEWGEDEQGNYIEIRAYYPKSRYPNKAVVINQAMSENAQLEREYDKMKKFKSIT